MNENKKIYYGIAAAAVVISAVIVLSGRLNLDQQKDESRVRFGTVDSYRKGMIQKKRLERDRVRVENHRNAPSLNSGYRPVEVHDTTESGLKLESSVNQGAKDAAESRSNTLDYSPEAQINKLLVKKQKYKEMTSLQKKKYVKEFQREARSLGFRLEFNDKMEVIHFKRVPASGSQGSEDDGYQGQEFYYDE